MRTRTQVSALVLALLVATIGLVGPGATPASADDGCACTQMCFKTWVYVNNTRHPVIDICQPPPSGWTELFYHSGWTIDNGHGAGFEQRVYAPPN